MKKRFFFLYLTTIIVVLLISSISLYFLYENNIASAQKSVNELLSEQISLIRSIYHETKDIEKTKLIVQKSLILNVDSYSSNEIAIGELRNDSIYYLNGLNKIKEHALFAIPFNSDKGIPMQKAFKEKQGTIFSVDYKGDEVFAAYQYLPELKWGVVSKVDIEEIKKSFFSIAIIIFIFSFVLVFLSSLILSRITLKIDKEFIKVNKLIEENEHVMRMLVNSIPNTSILIFDKDHRFIIAGGGELEKTGFEKSSIIGKTLKESFPKEVSDLFEPLYKKAIAGENSIFEMNFGEYVYNQQIISISTKENEIIAGAVISENISERKKVEKILKEKNEEIATQNEEYKQINEELLVSREKIEETKSLLQETNEFLENLFKYANAPIIVWDLNYNITRLNPAFEELTGMSKEEVMGKPFHLFFPDNEVKKSMELLQHAQEGKKWETVEIEILRKDNTTRTVLWNSANILDADEKTIIATIAQGHDITKRKESEKLFQDLIEKNPTSIQVIDIDGYTLKVNEAYTKLFGSVPPSNYSFFKDFKIENVSVDSLMESVKEGKIVTFDDFKFNAHNVDPALPNVPIWISMTVFPLNDFSGKPERFVLVHENITFRKTVEFILKEKSEEIETQNEEYKQINEEYKQINEELYTSKIKAEESDKLKSAFLANMSHEIRTPMNGIVGFADLLNDPKLSDKKKMEYTAIIINRSNQLLSVVNDILDISKIEAGLITVKNESVAINQVISDLWVFYSNQKKMKNIAFDKKLGIEGLEIRINADQTKIIQVLNNMLNNALKFTTKGEISFGYELKGQMLEFFVKDTGVGVPENFKDKIFGRFMQAENELIKNHGGTGLGLSISKELVTLMGGKIWLESELGVGTTMFFTIPYFPLNNETELLVESVITTIENHIEGKSILIVDDDEVNLLYLKEFLARFNLNIFEATNGFDAVEQFKQNNNINLVLMDIKMPIMSGLEATKLIKSINSKITVVAQTAYAMTSEKEQALKDGFDDYISKPLNKQELIDMIKKYL